ncbi:MAG: relaxase/mobilization nuclease domain-containing protein [Amphritea sp.]
MINKVTKGRSFVGAARYYLADKREHGEAIRTTDKRVEFTHTCNIPTQDGWKAAKWMAHTAEHQNEIKQAAGGSAKGRKGKYPVYTYALSWHPEQNPTRDEMIAAGEASLKANDLDQGYEVLMVAHNDEPHAHLHVIVNRVHPETGISAPLSKDFYNLSKWAEQYEMEQGKVYCEERVKNNKRRRNKEWVKDSASLSKADFYRWRRDQQLQAYNRRRDETEKLSDYHRRQREALYKSKSYQVKELQSKIKETYCSYWANLYRDQEQKRRIQQTDQQIAKRKFKEAVRNRNLVRNADKNKGLLSRVFNDPDKRPPQPPQERKATPQEKQRQLKEVLQKGDWSRGGDAYKGHLTPVFNDPGKGIPPPQERKATPQEKQRQLKEVLQKGDWGRGGGAYKGHLTSVFNDPGKSTPSYDAQKLSPQDKQRQLDETLQKNDLASDGDAYKGHLTPVFNNPGKAIPSYGEGRKPPPPQERKAPPQKSPVRQKDSRQGRDTGQQDIRANTIKEVEQSNTKLKALEKEQRDERKAIADYIKNKTEQFQKEIEEAYQQELDQLKEQQRAERYEQGKEHSEKSQEAARQIVRGDDYEQYKQQSWAEKLKGFQDSFRDMGRDQNQDKDKDRDRGRERPPPGGPKPPNKD